MLTDSLCYQLPSQRLLLVKLRASVGSAAYFTMPDSSSRSIANWVLQQKIGSGSFAVVWKAVHAETRSVVAVKEISTDRLNKKLKQSLESEVSILKQIRHRNIVRLEDVVEVRFQPYCQSLPLLCALPKGCTSD